MPFDPQQSGASDESESENPAKQDDSSKKDKERLSKAADMWRKMNQGDSGKEKSEHKGDGNFSDKTKNVAEGREKARAATDGPSGENEPFHEPKKEVEVIEATPVTVKVKEVSDVQEVSARTEVASKEALPGHADVPEGSPGAQDIDPDLFKEDFWDILEQAGISKQRFFALIFGFLAFVVIVAFFLFGGLGIFKSDGSDKKDDEVKEIVDEEDAVGDENGVSDQNYGVITSYIFGLENVEGASGGFDLGGVKDLSPLGANGSGSGVDTAFVFGTKYNASMEDLVYYFSILRKLENMYNTDIYALLDRANNRAVALDSHLSEMNDLIVEGERIYEEINLKLDGFNTEYALVIDDRDFYEESVFGAMDLLAGEDAYEYLELFVESGQVAFEIRALYNTYGGTADMLFNALTAAAPRYDDILANRNALIKGVRVFDIPQSNIDAIIRVEEGQ